MTRENLQDPLQEADKGRYENDDNLNKMGELLETDNRDLLETQGRVNTGLTKALEKELQRLHKEEGKFRKRSNRNNLGNRDIHRSYGWPKNII